MTQQSKNILTGFPVVIGLIAVTLASASSIVQMEEVVFTACYVPDVGVMYRIKAESLPEACTEDTHVEFSWNMEGPAGPRGPAGPQGPQGSSIARVVFAGLCMEDAFVPPGDSIGSRAQDGVVITDSRFTISDPAALLSVWESEPETPGVLAITDGFGGYFLEDGRLLLMCRGGDSYVAIVSF